MRFFSALASACALATAALAADSPPTSSEQRFADFRRLAQLSPTIQLNDASYRSLTSAPRDYSVSVLLTALDPRFGCQLCREFQPEWELVGRSWMKGDKKGEARIFFATLDFSEGRDVFLQVRTAVRVLHHEALDADVHPLVPARSSVSKLRPCCSFSPLPRALMPPPLPIRSVTTSLAGEPPSPRCIPAAASLLTRLPM